LLWPCVRFILMSYSPLFSLVCVKLIGFWLCEKAPGELYDSCVMLGLRPSIACYFPSATITFFLVEPARPVIGCVICWFTPKLIKLKVVVFGCVFAWGVISETGPTFEPSILNFLYAVD